jgi:hypothetical protein
VHKWQIFEKIIIVYIKGESNMKKHKKSVVIILLGICIIAIALGYVGSKGIPESTTFVSMDAGSTGIVIPQYLITSEVEDILHNISLEYPENFIFADNEVILESSETVNSFKHSISENKIDFDMDAVPSFYCVDASTGVSSTEVSVVVSDLHIAYFPPRDSVIISYDDLGRLLNGDNETISYYRELLNISRSDGENASVVVIKKGYANNSPDQPTGAAVVTR